MNENISQEEKIDYIYSTLRKNEKRALIGTVLKWGFRLFLVGYMIYFIKVGLPLMIDSFMPDMSGITGISEGISADQIKNTLGEYFNK